MNISVIICSVNRPAILQDTVASIISQTYPPTEILIVSPAEQHVLRETLDVPTVRLILSPLGSTIQRNRALDKISSQCDLIAFFDDDIELSTSYLAEMVKLFSENGEILIASGKLLHDGGRSTIITRDRAKKLCDEYDRNPTKAEPGSSGCTPTDSGYGCNMIVRCAPARETRFDEGLPLYAWLEDRDYSHRVTMSAHFPVEFGGAVGVHLGSRSGRIGGVRMGFSEIINPIYLWAKNRTFPLHYLVIQYWIRCLVGNVLGILTCDSEYDRIGLLKGNLIGFWHVLTGSWDPGYITEI
jgi:glycosyltransferase involved in cell wall biosynthesis